MSAIPKSGLADELARLGMERARKSAEELCGDLLAAFAASVDQQLADGEITPAEQTAIVKVMEGMNLAIRDDIAEAILKLEAEEEFHKGAAKLRLEFGKSRGALARRLKWSLLGYLQDRGIRKVTGEEHAFSVKKNPTKLVINEAAVPDEWKKDDTKCVPDRAKIEAALDAGETLDFAHYEQAERLEVK
jgi:hypothetical protein